MRELLARAHTHTQKERKCVLGLQCIGFGINLQHVTGCPDLMYGWTCTHIHISTHMQLLINTQTYDRWDAFCLSEANFLGTEEIYMKQQECVSTQQKKMGSRRRVGRLNVRGRRNKGKREQRRKSDKEKKCGGNDCKKFLRLS